METKLLASVLCCLSLWSSLILATDVQATSQGLHNFTTVNEHEYGRFSDVSYDAWYYDSVMQAHELGLMTGNSESTFNPTGNITQAEILTIVARLHKIYSTGNDDFSDVKQEMQEMKSTILDWCNNDQDSPAYKEFYETWYSPYVYYIYKEVFPEGRCDYPQFPALAFESFYAPFIDTTEPVKRWRFVSYLIGAIPESELQQINIVDEGAIPDVDYDPDIYTMYRAGILTGNDSIGTFSPTSSITRAEVAAIIGRMVNPYLRKNVTLTSNEYSADNESPINDEPSQEVISVSDSNISIEEPTNILVEVYCDYDKYSDGISLTAEWDNGDIIETEWSEWDEWKIYLKIIPLQAGTTTLRISAVEAPEEYKDIIVNIPKLNNNSEIEFNYTEEECYELAKKVCEYIKEKTLIYPDSFDLLTADAGILNGKLAVSFSYFHLTAFGKRDWVVRAYTCSENGRVSTFYTWDSNVNYTSMIKLDASLIMME